MLSVPLTVIPPPPVPKETSLNLDEVVSTAYQIRRFMKSGEEVIKGESGTRFCTYLLVILRKSSFLLFRILPEHNPS